LRPCDRLRSPSFTKTGDSGAWGERVAACFLRRHGYKILVCNYVMPWGELDLVCRHQGTLVFVEVKARGENPWTSGIAAVTPSKQRRLIRTAHSYLGELSERDMPIRFDAVEVELIPGQVPKCELYEAAFDAGVMDRSKEWGDPLPPVNPARVGGIEGF
jgi:putative endonuclease